MCDYAVGSSRQFSGSIIPSKRPNHAMMEVWNPLGIVGVITAFNFLCAVLGWNACIALVCGNCVVWKGAPTTPLVTCRGVGKEQASWGHFYVCLGVLKLGGKVLTGGSVIDRDGNFVEPTLVEISHDAEIVREELFGPVLYVFKIKSLEEAIELNNEGLSSSIFTQNPPTIFTWIGSVSPQTPIFSIPSVHY